MKKLHTARLNSQILDTIINYLLLLRVDSISMITCSTLTHGICMYQKSINYLHMYVNIDLRTEPTYVQRAYTIMSYFFLKICFEICA